MRATIFFVPLQIEKIFDLYIIYMTLEFVLLGLSLLFLLSILAGKASSRFGVPALLLFLVVGMLCGSDGIFGFEFDNIEVAQTIGTVALCVILFSGGLDTKFNEIRPVMAQGLMLATVGVALTSLITGLVVWWIFGLTVKAASIGLLTSLLLASTMSSTDSASVFAILRSKGLRLKNNLRPMLELESGSNDPVAYILVIVFMEIVKAGNSPSFFSILGMIFMQLCIGAIAGFAFGKLAVWAINRIKLDNPSLYPIFVFTSFIFIYSATYFMRGNGFLAVYIGGLIIGNSSFLHKRSTMSFFDGLTWLCQLLMFLTLGLLVNPHELLDVWIPGIIISFVMIFISRPLSVFLSLIPFRKMAVRDKIYTSWCGLRGAVPIIFAIMPLAADVPHARYIFNVVFFCTLVSLLVQGTSLPAMAKWLKLDDRSARMKDLEDFDVDFSDEIKSVTTEITLTDEMLARGNHLMDLGLPDKTLVVMVKRNKKFFVPTGKTSLKVGDILLIISDDHDALFDSYQALNSNERNEN